MDYPLFAQADGLYEDLDEEQMETISGGIIIVGGMPNRAISRLSSVMLNPQPLPPKTLKLSSY